MPRKNRSWTSQLTGSFHIISRVSGGELLFNNEEKEYFLKLLERFASGFFVDILSFTFMSNHFHILANGLELDAKKASLGELKRRYQLIYGENLEYPAGSFDTDGTLIPDEDGGIERLRIRLGSISRFVQELKQTFSRWYNKKHDRKGYLWSDRFKGVIVDKGDAQLACSAYIDLNPARAGIVNQPEKYRWSSMGLRVRNPRRAEKLLKPISLPEKEKSSEFESIIKEKEITFIWYREFVYRTGGIDVERKASISGEIVEDVLSYHGRLGIGDILRYRVRNFSEGIAIGTHSFIADIQRRYNRKFIRPRSFTGGKKLFTTRVLRTANI